METETLWFSGNENVTIATRHETVIAKAPAIITVITAEEIKNAGYRTLLEILKTVPGFEILKNGHDGSIMPVVRGLKAGNRVLIMFDGHQVNNPLDGDSFSNFDDFPVEGIKRIEIIRGPGSAMYGENALVGVINIITKDANDINGVRVSSGYGSFNTYDENIVFGEKYGHIEVSGIARYRQTDGFDGTVASDSQTLADSAAASFGYPAASLAPGEVDDHRREFDLNLNVVYKDFYVKGLYINKNTGFFIGPQLALTDDESLDNNYVFGEVGYKKTFEERFTIKPRIYYDQFDRNAYIKSLPDGSTVSSDADGDGVMDTFKTYPDGFKVNSMLIERIAGFDAPIDYELFDGNIVTLGFAYRYIKQTNVHFLSNVDPVTLDPLDSVQDFSDTNPQIGSATRNIGSVYLQDTWDITDTINLTLGGRYDHYDDFGGVVSPRSGLSWAFMKNASLKLLYGEAFRAPSFAEMHAVYQKNSIIRGNENLDPETTKTYEAGLSYQFNKHVTSGVNYFYKNIENLISLQAGKESSGTVLSFENMGDARIQGVEFETKIDIMKDNYVFMNYTFQNPEDEQGDDMPFVAQHYGNFGVNVHAWKYVNTNLNTFVSGARSREKDDTRDDLPAYALLNLSVIGKNFFRTMEVQGTVFNLLDKEYSDPASMLITDDLPRPGRTYFIGLSYQF
jgi:iron complex outermembrane receptor protein